MKATQGPWKVMFGTGVYAPSQKTGKPVLVCKGRINSEADARLIAAAPEMLEALEAAFDKAKGIPKPTLDLMWAAIAKARGEV